MKSLIPAGVRRIVDRVLDWRWVRFVRIVLGRYNQHNGPLLAAGLAFFLILAFIPLLLLGIACLGFYLSATGGAGNAAVTVQEWIKAHVLPGVSGDVADRIIQRTAVRSAMVHITQLRSISGLIGFVGLIWSSLQTFITGSVALNAAWGVREKRSWIRLRLNAVWLLVGSGALMGLSIAATAAGTIWEHYVPGIAISLGTEAAALVASIVMYALIYRTLPSTQVSVRAAFFGALIAGTLVEVVKKGLAVYLLHPNKSLYGGLAGMFALLLWTYYTMAIFLIGAESAAAYSRVVESAKPAEP